MFEKAGMIAPGRLLKGAGCPQCKQSGYIGRTAVHEMVEMTGDITEKIINKSSYNNIYDVLQKQGFSSLLKNGLEKVKQGVTTVDEVYSIVNE